jgi:hypothetical protein
MANNSIGAYAQGGSNEIGAYEFAASGSETVTAGAPDALAFTGNAPVVIIPTTIVMGAPDALITTGITPVAIGPIIITMGAPDALLFTGIVPVSISPIIIQMGAPDALLFTGFAPSIAGGDGKIGGITAGLYGAKGAITH